MSLPSTFNWNHYLGPFPFPLLGNLPQITNLSLKHGGIVGAMKQLRKDYGPVFTIWMGPQPTVHIATMELAQETMVKRGGEFVDRWVPLLFNAVRSKILDQRLTALFTITHRECATKNWKKNCVVIRKTFPKNLLQRDMELLEPMVSNGPNRDDLLCTLWETLAWVGALWRTESWKK